MSVPKLISPLLDGFVMGDAISDHDGVRCCPAMRVSDSGKYIVKIISLPASQTKLDALLLAGAFSDRASALEYYHQLSQDILEEAVLLQRFAQLEGFVSYEGWQLEPMEDDAGYDVYLLAPYHATLERVWRKEPLTHLQAVNLGLDLCSALAACRRSGWLYADLKPENICICANGEYRLSDLGFISLASLDYAALPERYHTAYTAPEITDAYSALNSTLDTYALGLVLYQVFNGGVLPEAAPGQSFRAPEYADVQMAQIILKACAPDPADRWEDPVQMGQALVSYLQSNTVNNTPIIPPQEPEAVAEPEEVPSDEPSTEEVLAEVDQALEAATVFPEEPAEEVTDEETPADEVPAEETTEEEPIDEEITEEEPVDEVTAAEESVGEVPVDEEIIEEETVAEEPADEESVEEEIVAEEETIDEAPAEEETTEEETEEVPPVVVPEEGTSDWTDAIVSEEFTPVLEQADDLIAHEPPEPVVVPESVDIPIPPVPSTDAPASDEETESQDASDEESEEVPAEETQPGDEEPVEEEVPAEPDPAAPPAKKRRKLGWLIGLLIALFLVAAAYAANYFYYHNYYLQSVQDLQLSGAEDHLTVRLDTAIDNALLTVYCTDTYGNSQKLPVTDNTVTFTGLRANTRYKIHVEIEGFHKLIGVTSDTYTTDEQTVISGFTSVAGDTDGSVILNFTVQGPETGEWNLVYACPGEAEKTLTFTGHMANVTGLTPGKTYTFRLEPSEPLYMVGENTLEYTATKLIYAQQLSIESFVGGKLTAVWQAPEGVTVEKWTVRCSGENGAGQTFVVTEPRAVFENLDPAGAYTVQVTAEGMSVSATAFITANSVTIDSVTVDDSLPDQLLLSWTYQGTTPANGWLILYTATGWPEQQVIRTEAPSATITPLIPGTSFTFTIQSADGSTVFGGTASYEAPAAETFAGFMVTAADLTFRMCRTPAKEAWTQADVPAADYVNIFVPGEKASFAISVGCVYGISEEEIRTLAVIRDENGNVVDTFSVARSWSSMWYKNFGKLDLPSLPQTPGNYTIEVYFNEAIVTTQSFTIAEPVAEGV